LLCIDKRHALHLRLPRNSGHGLCGLLLAIAQR
jgi:hypothetical protein